MSKAMETLSGVLLEVTGKAQGAALSERTTDESASRGRSARPTRVATAALARP